MSKAFPQIGTIKVGEKEEDKKKKKAKGIVFRGVSLVWS